VGYYYCNTGGSYELFGLSILRLNSQSEISAKNRSKPKKYGHFASIVIEINRSKLIILHRNLDVNESQFQDKSKQIILHHRSLCKMIVIEINRSKLIILHRNLDVNESQFQDKSKQIILHHRSLCKMIVIEINRSKLIILHRNLDVNESQGEFQENKSKQIILHHRSLCKIDGKFKTDHFASQSLCKIDGRPRTKNVEALKQWLNTNNFLFFNWILFFFSFFHNQF